MKISELRAWLLRQQSEFGDLECFVTVTNVPRDINSVGVVVSGDSNDPPSPYVLIAYVHRLSKHILP